MNLVPALKNLQWFDIPEVKTVSMKTSSKKKATNMPV